jgi:hypothetical protein
MAIRFQIRDTVANTTLASYDVPDAAKARLQQVWAPGPGTAAENALRFAVTALQEETEQRVVAAEEAAAVQAVQTANANLAAVRASAASSLNTDFPPPLT